MKNIFILISISLLPVLTFAQVRSSQEILEKSIQYHDPEGQWPLFKERLFFKADLADKSEIFTEIEIDNRRGYFKFKQEEANTEIGILQDSCFIISGDSDCNAIKKTRNYWIYLWGLPMKLKDPGTNVDTEVQERKLKEFDCYVIRVPYVKDTWYFYIDKSNFALRAYEFFVDEEKRIGERIYLEGEFSIDKMRIPQSRSWYYTHEDKRFLATDQLLKNEKL